jgi:hypothetical protein
LEKDEVKFLLRMTNSATQRISELVGRRTLGEPVEAKLIAWACDMLAEGHDTKSLRLLAGGIKNDSPQEIAEEFNQALIQLGYSIPSKREALNDYGCFVCRRIVDGEIDLDIAHKVLYDIWQKTVYDSEFKGDRRFDVWMYLSDSLGLIEGGLVKDGFVLLPQFKGLSRNTYHDILKCEAQSFIGQHCKSIPANLVVAQNQSY